MYCPKPEFTVLGTLHPIFFKSVRIFSAFEWDQNDNYK